MVSVVGKFNCQIGLHVGRIEPAHEIDEPIDGHSAFVCSRCGAVIE